MSGPKDPPCPLESEMKKVLSNATSVLSNVISCYPIRERVIQCNNVLNTMRKQYKNRINRREKLYQMQEMCYTTQYAANVILYKNISPRKLSSLKKI